MSSLPVESAVSIQETTFTSGVANKQETTIIHDMI
jgi:hypothetical protein